MKKFQISEVLCKRYISTWGDNFSWPNIVQYLQFHGNFKVIPKERFSELLFNVHVLVCLLL